MRRYLATVLFAAASLLLQADPALAQYNGVFTSPWYAPLSYHSAYHSYHVPVEAHPGVTNVELWKNEVLDMQRAGLHFFAPYSFGQDSGFWADPAVFGPTMSSAILQTGTPVRMAFFLDTQGAVRSQYILDGGGVDANGNPTQPVFPFQLGRGQAHWRTILYERNIKRFFNNVSPAAQFRPDVNRPVMFFYASFPHWTDRQGSATSPRRCKIRSFSSPMRPSSGDSIQRPGPTALSRLARSLGAA